MRSKREKRLRAIRREIVEPFYEKKEEAKLAALEAALAAPKLPVKPSPNSNTTTFSAMEVATTNTPNDMVGMAHQGGFLLQYECCCWVLVTDLVMADDNQSMSFLKATGGVGKKSKMQFKVGKRRRHGKGKGKGKVKKRHI
ncbi:hypothetical protein FEM48_Zijuj01G0031800 [Ziziphus jujuba var. spinosa]|uniref:Uncharacterized protein n=1 Tax=Ziziphus jujuba var. spinosa TaxID=714518 RepID=A0A978VYT6_ZIZJJ|nr:hypothetical protein FEM48_Zijuj01G0031800 [Ziziphus jujuba var. spinosa]